ncbi:putative ferric-chelate reductase 1 [Mercenaria mercenaria]|uniref:putative ferric-chelate reductase 1 n=1 Tax=Mercenaria mercenaria TaxID=6596 RepID=UPI00234F3A7F|nr:putative ferric-chelate reductase 1 [Mercenaria mercenaria]
MALFKGIILKLVVTYVTIQTVSAELISWDSGCGSTKGCFPYCPKGCEYLVTWQTAGTSTTFTLQAEETDTNVYLAVGFSKDYRMGEDSVVGCIVPGTTVKNYYNEGTDTDELATPLLGLSGTSVTQTNGVITCTFTRTLNEASDDKYFDLNNDYILMLVVGEAEEEDGAYKLEEHHKIPWNSDGKVDFNSHYVVDLYKLNSPAVKLHGIMMVLAWLLLVIVGMVTARYNKDMLPEEKLFGTKVWFQVHRTAMVVACVFVVIGFIPIFVEIRGYSQIVSEESKESVKAHPVLGIVVTVLCFLNPIMALFRPGGDHKFRWIFNWAHLGVGAAAQILAIVTIFLGYVLERSMLSNKAIWMTITHLIVLAIICAALEINKWMTTRKKNQVENRNGVITDDIEMKEEKEPIQEPTKPSVLPFALLLLLGGFLIGSTLAILVIIADS